MVDMISSMKASGWPPRIGMNVQKMSFPVAQRHRAGTGSYHLTKGCVWARVEEILTGLRFIDAKCRAGMTYELVKDYDVAMNEIPEGRDERESEQRREEEIKRYTH